VAAAVRVGLGAAVVDRELQLEVVLGVAQVDQGEIVERETVRGGQAERLLVEGRRARLVQNPDHGVDHLRHRARLNAPPWQEASAARAEELRRRKAYDDP